MCIAEPTPDRCGLRLLHSLATTLCLQYGASKLAHAAMCQVAKLAKFKPAVLEGTSIHEFFGIPLAELDGEDCRL